MRHVLSYDIVHEGQGNRHYRKPRCGNVLHISFCRDSRDSLGGCKTRDVDNELKAQGARVRWNVESVAADFANAPSLEEIIADAKSSFSDSDQHRGLDRIFEVLSKQEKYRWLFDEIAILYSSTGFTSEDVTSPYYRIIAFNENLFLAFTTKPDGKFYDVLEAFEYRQDNKFHFL